MAYRTELQKVGVQSVQSVQSIPVSFVDFPLDVFPDVVSEYIKAQSAAKNIDPAFIAVPMLGVFASAVGNSVGIEIQDDWTQISSLWCLSVAGSGEGKSPGLDSVTPPLFDVDKDAKKLHELALSEYQEEPAFIQVITAGQEGTEERAC